MELLRGLTAAQVLEYRAGTDDSEQFRLSPEMAEVLANEESSLSFNAGAFAGGVDMDMSDLIVEAFRTGIGYTYKSRGERGGERSAEQTKRCPHRRPGSLVPPTAAAVPICSPSQTQPATTTAQRRETHACSAPLRASPQDARRLDEAGARRPGRRVDGPRPRD